MSALTPSAVTLEVRRRQRVRGAPAPAPVPKWRATAAAAAPAAIALGLWLAAARDLDVRAMSSLGLVSVLPAGAWAALALLGVSFGRLLRRRRFLAVAAFAHVVALVIMVYGLPSVVEPEPRFGVTWRHVGVIDTILRTGEVDPQVDAYFNWPGFFVLGAFLTDVAGLETALSLTRWAPVAFELLYLAPLLALMRALTASQRVVWLAIWLFYLGNWVGQDYFSPQAFAYLLYLVILAVLLTWLRAPPRGRPPWARLRLVRRLPGDGGRPQFSAISGPARAAVVAMVLTLFVAMVPSHQLTPFAILPGVTALVLARRCAARGLPLVMAVVLGAWLSYMTVAYLAGHAETLAGDIGKLSTTVNENVGGRLQGDPGHLFVTKTRVGLTAALWLLALLGAVRRARRGHDDVPAMLLWAGPFLLPVLQPYGGEILLRVFLFSLPFTAFFVAALIATPAAQARSRRTAVVVVALTLVLMGALMLSRYGNERTDWFSSREVAAVERLYAEAPEGSTLVAWTNSLPWKAQDYDLYRYRVIIDHAKWSPLALMPAGSPAQVEELTRHLRTEPRGAFVVLTRSQEAELELAGAPPGSLDRIARALTVSPAFERLHADRDGSVFRVVPAPEAGP